MPYNETSGGSVNPELLGQEIEQSEERLELRRKREEANALAQQNEKETEAQALAEQQDPRNKEQWGIGGVAKELQSVLTGGLQDTASSIVTFPERTLDALNGEMKAAGADYRPDWDPFTDYDNPIETKTWWGKLLRGTVHFGSLALVPIAGQRALGFKIANSFVRAAGIGAVSDLISKESDGHNALGAMRDSYGFIDTPLSTKETDHPIMMKVKNILEGMGIGTAFDGAAILLGKGSKRVVNSVKARNKSIADQTIEKGLQELKDGHKDFRGAKNKPIAKKFKRTRKACLIFGGETTVNVIGKGKGGRNQELVLHLSRELKNVPCIISSIGTDGIDGNTKFAGAIVSTVNLPPFEKFLKNNDSFNFFKKFGGLLHTGPTHTNVNDIGVILRHTL